jgi:hypothetical protein
MLEKKFCRTYSVSLYGKCNWEISYKIFAGVYVDDIFFFIYLN